MARDRLDGAGFTWFVLPALPERHATPQWQRVRKQLAEQGRDTRLLIPDVAPRQGRRNMMAALLRRTAGLRTPSWRAVGVIAPGLPVIALGRMPCLARGMSLHGWSTDPVDLTDPPAPLSQQVQDVDLRLWFDAEARNRRSGQGPAIGKVAPFEFLPSGPMQPARPVICPATRSRRHSICARTRMPVVCRTRRNCLRPICDAELSRLIDLHCASSRRSTSFCGASGSPLRCGMLRLFLTMGNISTGLRWPGDCARVSAPAWRKGATQSGFAPKRAASSEDCDQIMVYCHHPTFRGKCDLIE